MPLSILIADDHVIVRVGLRTLFQGTNIVVKGEASSGEEVLSLIAQNKYDVILLDVRMVGGDGLNVLGRIKLDSPNTLCFYFLVTTTPPM